MKYSATSLIFSHALFLATLINFSVCNYLDIRLQIFRFHFQNTSNMYIIYVFVGRLIVVNQFQYGYNRIFSKINWSWVIALTRNVLQAHTHTHGPTRLDRHTHTHTCFCTQSSGVKNQRADDNIVTPLKQHRMHLVSGINRLNGLWTYKRLSNWIN